MNKNIILNPQMINNVSNFEKTIGEFLGATFAIPAIDNGNKCSLLMTGASEINKLFSLSVEYPYRFYILYDGTILFATALSDKHDYYDKKFIANYEKNFNNSPHGDITFSFMELLDGKHYPFICYETKNIFQTYNLFCSSSNDIENLNSFYYVMLKNAVEYIEKVKNEIIKPYHRKSFFL